MTFVTCFGYIVRRTGDTRYPYLNPQSWVDSQTSSGHWKMNIGDARVWKLKTVAEKYCGKDSPACEVVPVYSDPRKTGMAALLFSSSPDAPKPQWTTTSKLVVGAYKPANEDHPVLCVCICHRESPPHTYLPVGPVERRGTGFYDELMLVCGGRPHWLYQQDPLPLL